MAETTPRELADLAREAQKPLPRWLQKVSLDARGRIRRGRFPLREILDGSLYYPASGFDRSLVDALLGFVHSFVYTDYGITELGLLLQVRDPPSPFRGYRLFGSRPVTARELGIAREPMPAMGHPPRASDRVKPFFSLWMVFERLAEPATEHGPERFSVLFVCADGVSMYDTLYRKNETAPRALAVISGSGTDLMDPRGSLANLVLRRSGEHIPEYLVCDGQANAFWPEQYPELVGRIEQMRPLGMWRRRA
jgi:hypothetical protein